MLVKNLVAWINEERMGECKMHTDRIIERSRERGVGREMGRGWEREGGGGEIEKVGHKDIKRKTRSGRSDRETKTR